MTKIVVLLSAAFIILIAIPAYNESLLLLAAIGPVTGLFCLALVQIHKLHIMGSRPPGVDISLKYNSERIYIRVHDSDTDKQIKEQVWDWDSVSNAMPGKYKTRSATNKICAWHLLGIMPTTEKSKVLSAYKKMAMVYHPDQGDSAKMFQLLSTARDEAIRKCQ